MPRIYAVDPGMTSGVFVGDYDEASHLLRHEWHQIPGGVKAFSLWFDDEYVTIYGREFVCEKFSPRPMARTLLLDELEPIRIEGFLYASLYNQIHWQDPAKMVLRSGATQAQRKRNSDDVLRELGWYLTKKDTGLSDGNDANAAAKHALAYLKSINHMPTLELLQG